MTMTSHRYETSIYDNDDRLITKLVGAPSLTHAVNSLERALAERGFDARDNLGSLSSQSWDLYDRDNEMVGFARMIRY